MERCTSTTLTVASLGGMAPRGSRCRAYDDGLAQDGGAVWRRGDADGRPCKVFTLIAPEDGMVEDGGSDFCCAYVACTEDRLDRFVLPAR